MSLTTSELAKSMIGAARVSFGRDWRAARKYAEPELRRLARVLVDIGKLTANGKVTRQEAKSLLRIHRNTTEVVLLTVQGLGIIAVERAVNAALGAVRDAVNAATGFRLL